MEGCDPGPPQVVLGVFSRKPIPPLEKNQSDTTGAALDMSGRGHVPQRRTSLRPDLSKAGQVGYSSLSSGAERALVASNASTKVAGNLRLLRPRAGPSWTDPRLTSSLPSGSHCRAPADTRLRSASVQPFRWVKSVDSASFCLALILHRGIPSLFQKGKNKINRFAKEKHT